MGKCVVGRNNNGFLLPAVSAKDTVVVFQDVDDLAGHRASSSPRIAEVYENIKFVSDSSELCCPLPDEMWKYYHESRFASLIRIY